MIAMQLSDPNYIQWFLKNDEMQAAAEPFLEYSKAKAQLLNNVSLQFYSEKIKNRFAQNNQDVNRFFNFASNLIQDKNFETTLNNAIEALPMPQWTSRAISNQNVQEYLTKNTKEFNKFIDELNIAISGIINMIGIGDYTEVVLPGSEVELAIKNLFQDFQSYDRIIKLSTKKDLDAKYQGQYRSLITSLPELSMLLNSETRDYGSIFKVLQKILVFVQTLTGICNEFQVEYEANKLLDNFKKTLQSDKIKISRVGDTGLAGGFRTGTADIGISLGDNAHFSFNIPDLGISLKRSHKDLSKTQKVSVKLKGTTYGALMHELDPSLVTAFYTLYSNTRPTVANIKQANIPAGTLTGAYNYMKAMILVPALIGNINAPELVTIFVTNNQAWTIFDLLGKIADNSASNENIMTMKPAFSSKRKEIQTKHEAFFNQTPIENRQRRSDLIRNEINKISVNIWLTLVLKDLI